MKVKLLVVAAMLIALAVLVAYGSNEPGTLKWRFETGDTVESSPAIGSDGTIYASSWNGYIYAISPDGSLKWKYKTRDGVFSSPAIGTDGTIYVGSGDNYLYAISPDGSLRWKFWTGSYVSSSPAIGTDGTIYVGSWNGYIYALSPDGSLKWRFETGDAVYSSPAIGEDGTIYVGSNDNYLYAISPDGSLKWKYKTGEYSSPAIGTDGTIYVGSDDNYLYAISPDGSLRWKFQTGSYVGSSPAIGTDGTIYVGSWDDYLYAINSSSLGPADSPWPMFHHDVKHTGRVGPSSAFVPPLSGAPEILRIEFPSRIIGDGRENLGKVYFRDPDADITHAYFKPVGGTGNWSPFDFDPEVRGEKEGSFDFIITCETDERVTARFKVTLIDDGGNTSKPVYFFFTCVGP